MRKIQVNRSNNRLFAGQGHVTMSIIKVGGGTKWLPEMKRAWSNYNETSIKRGPNYADTLISGH